MDIWLDDIVVDSVGMRDMSVCVLIHVLGIGDGGCSACGKTSSRRRQEEGRRGGIYPSSGGDVLKRMMRLVEEQTRSLEKGSSGGGLLVCSGRDGVRRGAADASWCRCVAKQI